MKWKYYKATDGLTAEQVEGMTNEELKSAEDDCMMKNAWKICEDVSNRIDGEPAPCGDMSSYVTKKKVCLLL